MLDLGLRRQLRAINVAASHRQRQTFIFSDVRYYRSSGICERVYYASPSRVAIGQGFDEHTDITHCVAL